VTSITAQDISVWTSGRLDEAYQRCLQLQDKVKKNLQSVNERLGKIDPKFIGAERLGSPLKFYWRKITRADEIKNLKRIRKINERLSKLNSEQIKTIEAGLKRFIQSDIRTEWRPFGIRLPVLSGLFRLPSKMAQSSSASSALKSPGENRKILLNFIGSLPVFQESPQLRETLEKQFPVSDQIQVSVQSPDTIVIECPKIKVRIDPSLPLSREECERADPSNPMLKTKERIVVDDLRQYGTIDSGWWEWLKVKNYPAFGPRIVLKKEDNEIQFKKGAPLLDAIEFREDGIAFKALFLEKVCAWKAEDFIGFLSKFTSERV